MIENRKIVSSHIFIFPFKWDYGVGSSIEERTNVDKFVELLGCEWKKQNRDIIEDSEYNKYTYFYDNVRQAIYGRNNYHDYIESFNAYKKVRDYCFKKKNNKAIVQCLKYNGLFSDSKYVISLDDDSKYILNLKDIKLKIYDTGVANLIYFLENCNENSTKNDILKINDFGRRIYPQYLPMPNCQKSFLAKELSLQLSPDKHPIEEYFNYDYKKYPTRISKTIMDILGNNFECIKEKRNSKKIFITPVIDDRMFVMCRYDNTLVSQSLQKYTKFNSIKDDFWYKYIFVDNGSATCQDNNMFENLLKESTYMRWKNYGTFYGISRYSFVLLKNENSPDYLNNHFHTIYFEMVLLALTQRASILRFSDEASKIAILNENETLKRVKSLQKLYIEFINNIYFREVTAQEQGIEMYDKLLEMMRIERDVKRLDEEINEIHKYTSQISAGYTNNLLHLITYFTTSITICGLVRELYIKHIANQSALTYGILGRLTIWPITLTIITLILISMFMKKGKVKTLMIIISIFIIASIGITFIP